MISRMILCAMVMMTCAAGVAYAGGKTESLIADGPKGGWQIFGHGVLDSVGDMDAKEVLIDVNWSQSTWGVGGMFVTKKAINAKKLKAIRVEAKTMSGSKPRVFGGISTPDDANMVLGPDNGIEIGSEFREVTLPVAQMKKDKPDVTSRMFTSNDWDKVQVFKILFSKPQSNAPEQDKIVFRNPELIFE